MHIIDSHQYGRISLTYNFYNKFKKLMNINHNDDISEDVLSFMDNSILIEKSNVNNDVFFKHELLNLYYVKDRLTNTLVEIKPFSHDFKTTNLEGKYRKVLRKEIENTKIHELIEISALVQKIDYFLKQQNFEISTNPKYIKYTKKNVKIMIKVLPSGKINILRNYLSNEKNKDTLKAYQYDNDISQFERVSQHIHNLMEYYEEN